MLTQLYKNDGDRLLTIAHRGASAYFPENTMVAFEGAVDLQADMIEFDIQLSKDGIPVIFHDAKLHAHTNGKGAVNDYTLDELKKLDAGSWFDQKFAGEQIPTLQEVLAFASGKIMLNLEIKTEAVTDQNKGGIEEKSLALVKKYDMQHHVLFSSFDYRAVRHLKILAPEMPVALLYEKKKSAKMLPSELVNKYNVDAFNCSYRQLNKTWLKDLQKHHIPFFIYTVDQPERMKKLISKGVNGIFTNRPDVLQSLNQDH